MDRPEFAVVYRNKIEQQRYVLPVSDGGRKSRRCLIKQINILVRNIAIENPENDYWIELVFNV